MIAMILDSLLHGLGYGKLFLYKLKPLAGILFILGNIALITIMSTSDSKSKSLFGLKLFFSIIIFVLLYDNVRAKLKILMKPTHASSRVHPDA